MRKMSKKWKRCVAALLACCMVFSATGVMTVFEGILERISMETSAEGAPFIYDGPAVNVEDTILYNDEMERISTTVLFKHWHLTRDWDNENKVWVTNTVEVPEEYRFYPAESDGSVIHLYKRVNKDDLYFTLEKIFYVDLTAEKPYENVFVEIYPQGTYNTRVPEKFSNFSISSGHDSIVQESPYTDADGNVVNSTRIKAYYSAPGSNIENHLIKGHAFYVSELELKVGVDFSEEGRKWLDLELTEQDNGIEGVNTKNPYWVDDNIGVVYTGEFDTAIAPDGMIYYDTSAGLHTDKTAYVTEDSEDGRTFDLELKAWYAGEDVADVGFVLDASGSMAWTTNPIEPLEITDEMINKLRKYYPEIFDPTTNEIIPKTILTSKQLNVLLNTANTDNTRLAYTEYNYYIYDARSSVSEFVPLGYWCGDVTPGVKSLDYDLIGYYPFEGDLDNEVDDDLDTRASFIKHAEDNGGVFDKDTTPDGIYEKPVYKNNTLDLTATEKKGGILLDVPLTSDEFTVSFMIRKPSTTPTSTFDETSIMYIGNLNSNGGNYVQISRGNKSSEGTSSGNSNRLRLRNSSNEEISSINNVFDGNPGWCKVTFVVDKGVVTTYVVDLQSGGNAAVVDRGTGSFNTTFDYSNLQIIIGGTTGSTNNIHDIELDELFIFNKALGDDEVSALHSNMNTPSSNSVNIDGLIGYYSFSGNLANSAPNATSAAKLIKQAEDGVFNPDSELKTEAKVEFNNTKYKGDQALNLTATAESGAIWLDATPIDNTYTIAFAMKKSDSGGASEDGNIMYIGDFDTSKTPNYRLRYDGTSSGGKNKHMRFDQNGPNVRTSANNVLDNTNWNFVTIVVDNTNVYVYVNKNLTGSSTINEFNHAENALNIILAGLADDYDGPDIYIDELYVFDKALQSGDVETLYDTINKTVDATTDTNPAYDGMGNVIARIPKSLVNNPSLSQRRGWYYVNSHSDWETLSKTESVATGKQFEGLRYEANGNSSRITEEQLRKATANVNIPKVYQGTDFEEHASVNDSVNPGYTCPNTSYYAAPQYFLVYINGKYYLRCYFNSGGTTNNTVTVGRDKVATDSSQDALNECRTQCSYVYYKPDRERTKVESLQYVLNTFTNNLENEAPRSRVSAVRFSMEPNEDGKLPAGEYDLSDTGALKSGTYSKKTTGTFTEGYYMDEDSELDHLVLLDWMKKSTSVGIVSARKAGIDTTMGKDQSNPNVDDENNTLTEGYNPYDPIDQYNYFLTGGTYTWTGLKAFYTQLASRRERYLNGYQIVDPTKRAHKYVILFTDGKDNLIVAKPDGEDENGNPKYTYEYDSANQASHPDRGKETSAIEWANLLKEEGYSIFCVMLSSGSVAEGTADYQACVAYLSDIAGPHTNYYGDYPNVEDYVFTPTDDKTLSRDFNTILERINSQLDDYTIQDTIDPRFDLVEVIDDQEHTIYLGENGSISIDGDTTGMTVYDKDGKSVAGLTSVNSENYYLFTALDGKEAKLYYSDDNDMYYLQWVEELIPGCAENADELEIWESRIRLRAKEDFIGGNSILTNGNAANMNYVFDPAESAENISSGTNKANPKQDADAYALAGNQNPYNPSKGFPRTTVNVRLYDIVTKPLYGEIYMGEAVTPAQLLSNVENEYVTDSYYLDYIKRYAYQRYLVNSSTSAQANMPIIDLLNEWLKIDNSNAEEKSFSIPYIYLPKVEYDDTGQLVKNGSNVAIFNNSGNAASKEDVVGILTYTWKKLEPKDGTGVINPNVWEYITTDTERIMYSLSVEYTPLQDDDTDVKLAGKFKDFVYIDDTNQKPAIEYDRIKANNDTIFQVSDGPVEYISNNDGLIREMQEPYEGSEQKWDVYRWDPVHKPVPKKAETQQPEEDRKYGSAELSADKRTLEADSTYTLDVVSGGLALELKVPVQDLKAVAIGEDDTGTGYSATFKMKATRKFVDTAYIESLIAAGEIDHFDDEFILTFEFHYTKDDVEELISGKDSEEYVSLFAKATKVKAVLIKTDGTEEEIVLEEHLPIGTYTFDVNTTFVEGSAKDFNDQNFIYMVDETNKEYFKTDYFEDIVLRGLATSNEIPTKILNDRTDLDFGEAEIDDENIQSYIADSKSTKSNHTGSSGSAGSGEENLTAGKKVAIFYLGTNSENKRGVADRESYPDEDCYIDDRLGIIVLSIGNTDLKISKTVENSNAQEVLDELWEFRITLTSDMELNNFSNIPLLYKDADGNDVTTQYEKQTVTFSSPVDQNTPVSYVYTAVIKLKHGHSVTIKGIGSGEENISYTVEELENTSFNPGDYEPSFTDQAGKLGPDTWVRCVNTFTSAELPDLGGMGTETQKNYGYLFVILSMLISGYLISYRFRQIKAGKR